MRVVRARGAGGAACEEARRETLPGSPTAPPTGAATRADAATCGALNNRSGGAANRSWGTRVLVRATTAARPGTLCLGSRGVIASFPSDPFSFSG